ncbi:bifunctional polysaccharide deacetylase/glycosyltransferase family 2 protein [Streptomyces cavernicola]|uniref:Bifunctional polysaccharide deacetylase/glycosyltransferase family 2 protein n=1 Tax=Streptomyces cavernicola TaxID=3043613 RepID=A0ABT6SK64_9ACTN|nr:bifunctional polysaccharide deacetylase/glycosyltransferase family 2 protein [Streptomyces sp. B-S-A6]MDI3408037.1 bifunctional polysaccharide deacetylase/glycosyltransferase family 2 protein [Streptomyces sp. B-S-A6]
MAARHKQARDPRAHWPLLFVTLSVLFGALLFHGWVQNEVDGAKDKQDCTAPVPRAAADAGPVLSIQGDRVRSASMPAGTVALTYDGGPDPEWTPRLLALLKKHDAHATFFLSGAKAAEYPDLVHRIRAEGHEIGSNTYTGADLGTASTVRGAMEHHLTQSAFAGADGFRTSLLRMPMTTTVPTLCGAEWPAARSASEDDGYLLVAADRPGRKPAAGLVRQFSQTSLAYRETGQLLADPDARRFATVSEGLRDAKGGPALAAGPAMTPASQPQQWLGTALMRFQDLGRSFVAALGVILTAAAVLGLIRLFVLVVFARAHVKRLERYRPGSPWLREIRDPVTVLVPAYNEEAGIGGTLRSLLASTHRQLQIIVIDDGSSDRTVEIAHEYADRDPRVQVICQPNAGKAAALNHGLKYARCPYVVMVDSDTVFEADAIERLVQPLAHPAVGAVSGNTKVGNRRRFLGRWQHLEYVFGFNLDRRMFEVLECMTTVPGAIGAFRLDALMGVGGLSEDTLAEDTDLTMALWRAGWRVVYEETAIAWTEVPTSLRQLWRQRYRWCYGTLQAMWKHRRAVFEVGPAGRFGRRGLSYLFLFQVVLPLLAPVIDVFMLYSALFTDSPVKSMATWIGFLAVQIAVAAYALKLDGERRRTLWSLPFQLFVYRQLMYLVVIQSVVAFVGGSRLKWQRMHRSGTAAAAAKHIGAEADRRGLPVSR